MVEGVRGFARGRACFRQIALCGATDRDLQPALRQNVTKETEHESCFPKPPNRRVEPWPVLPKREASDRNPSTSEQNETDRVGTGWVFVARPVERDVAVALAQGIFPGDGD